ncbi:BsaG protein (plasmid) [Staphylococcus agnetis]|uniref:HyiG n=1 Tax=Staphylococcus hyicus TaxID=1284 RepID=A0A1V0JZL3_STAHY|nr:HyiG [Staphylococcus hyicus]TRW80369.1 BsaG protein [Staphylococcus agnetis]
MINELRVCNLKFSNQFLTYLPILISFIFVFFINFYINSKTWDDDQISLYTSSFNVMVSIFLSINVYQVINFEENIGHFNHILSKPKRINWALSVLFFSYSITSLCIIIAVINLFIHTNNVFITLFFFVSSFVFNIITLIILFIFGVFFKSILSIIIGILNFIFNVYFGLEVLGDHSWFYMPTTYSTRYIHMYIENNIPMTLTIIMYIVSTIILFCFIYIRFNKWNGRVIKD